MIVRRFVLVLALLAPACPRPALAQEPDEAAPTPQQPTPQQPTPQQERELTEAYRRAQDHYLAKRYTEALPLFERVSRGLNSPNAQLYVARCHRELGHVVEAHAAMTETVELAKARAATEPRFEATRDEAIKELAALEARVGRLVVRLTDPPEGLVVEVAGRAIGLGEELVVAPGELRVDALVPGRPLHRQAVTARAGAVIEVHLALPAAPPEPATPTPRALSVPEPAPVPPAAPDAPDATSGGGVRIAGYVVLGASAAGFVTFAVAGVMANRRFSDVEEACGGPCTDPSYNDEIDGGRTMDRVANAGLGIGIGLGVAGALMVIFGGPSDEPANVSLAAAPLSGGGVMGIGGRF